MALVSPLTPTAIAAAGMLPPALVLCGAVWADCRTRRIPNPWCVGGSLAALFTQALLPQGLHPLHPTQAGTPGVGSGLLALAAMLLITAVAWRARWFGAGDAKLLSALAAYGAPSAVLPVLLLTAVCGGVMALLWWLARVRSPLPYSLAIAAAQMVWAGSMAAQVPVLPPALLFTGNS